jgi:DNA-binding MarR family transcriptional regulator
MGDGDAVPADRLVDVVDLADRTLNACLARITEAADISREQWRMLVLLDAGADHDAGTVPGHTMGELATRAAVPAPTATRLVDRLVADGLAYRLSDPWDRRRVLVHVSRDGHRLVADAAQGLDEVLGTVLAEVGVDVAVVAAALRRLAAAAGTAGAPASSPSPA